MPKKSKAKTLRGVYSPANPLSATAWLAGDPEPEKPNKGDIYFGDEGSEVDFCNGDSGDIYGSGHPRPLDKMFE